MLINTIKAEWIKLRSTKSFYWTTGLIAFFTIGWSLLMGYANGYAYQQAIDRKDADTLSALGSPSDVFSVDSAIAGLQLFGIMIVVIQAVIIVTGEYANGTAKLSSLAAPKRWQLPVAKSVVYGGLIALVFFVLGIVSVFLTAVMSKLQLEDDVLADGISLSADHAWTTILILVADAVALAMVSIGVGYLVRRTAGGIALLLLWFLLLEGLITMIPKVGDWVAPFLPFQNMNAGITQIAIEDAPWGVGGSIVYFFIICAVIFGASIAVLRRRDA